MDLDAKAYIEQFFTPGYNYEEGHEAINDLNFEKLLDSWTREKYRQAGHGNNLHTDVRHGMTHSSTAVVRNDVRPAGVRNDSAVHQAVDQGSDNEEALLEQILREDIKCIGGSPRKSTATSIPRSKPTSRRSYGLYGAPHHNASKSSSEYSERTDINSRPPNTRKSDVTPKYGYRTDVTTLEHGYKTDVTQEHGFKTDITQERGNKNDVTSPEHGYKNDITPELGYTNDVTPTSAINYDFALGQGHNDYPGDRLVCHNCGCDVAVSLPSDIQDLLVDTNGMDCTGSQPSLCSSDLNLKRCNKQTQTDCNFPEPVMALSSPEPVRRVSASTRALTTKPPSGRGSESLCQTTERSAVQTNVIFDCVRNGDGLLLEELLQVNSDAICSRDPQLNNILHVAVEKGQLVCVKLLASAHPELVVEENQGHMTPTAIAAKGGRAECLDWLLENTAAKVELMVKVPKKSLLHLAIKSGQDRCLRVILDKLNTVGKLDDCYDSNGNTPAHVAAKHGQLTCLQILLEYGLDVTRANKHGHSPLYYADFSNHKQCAGYLMVVDTCYNLARKLVKLERSMECLSHSLAKYSGPVNTDGRTSTSVIVDSFADRSSATSSVDEDESREETWQRLCGKFEEASRRLVVFRTQNRAMRPFRPSKLTSSARTQGTDLSVAGLGASVKPTTSAEVPLGNARCKSEESVFHTVNAENVPNPRLCDPPPLPTKRVTIPSIRPIAALPPETVLPPPAGYARMTPRSTTQLGGSDASSEQRTYNSIVRTAASVITQNTGSVSEQGTASRSLSGGNVPLASKEPEQTSDFFEELNNSLPCRASDLDEVDDAETEMRRYYMEAELLRCHPTRQPVPAKSKFKPPKKLKLTNVDFQESYARKSQSENQSSSIRNSSTSTPAVKRPFLKKLFNKDGAQEIPDEQEKGLGSNSKRIQSLGAASMDRNRPDLPLPKRERGQEYFAFI